MYEFSLNCSWKANVSASISWSVDGQDPGVGVEVDDSNDDESYVILNWQEMNKLPGDVVIVICSGQTFNNVSNGDNSTFVSQGTSSVINYRVSQKNRYLKLTYYALKLRSFKLIRGIFVFSIKARLHC